MNQTKKIASNVGWLAGERLVTMALQFGVGLYVVRYLGAEDFGKLSYSLGFAGLFYAPAKLGLDAIVVRNLVKEPESSSQIMGTAFVLKVFSSILTVIAIAFLIFYLNPNAEIRWLTIMLGSAFLFSPWEVIDFWFQSQVRSKAIALVKTSQRLVEYGSKLCLIRLTAGLMPFGIINTVGMGCYFLGCSWAYARESKRPRQWRFEALRARNMLRDSLPLVFSGVMVAVYLNIDRVMLGNLVNATEVGIYGAASRLSEVWYFLPTAICGSVFPAIVRAKQRSETLYKQRVQQLYDVMAWLAWIVVIPVTFLATPTIRLIFGAEYLPAGQILAWHIWASPFVFLGVARSKWLMSENLTLFHLATTVCGAVANIVLNWYLIPLYGGMGAAIATVISYAVSSHGAALLFPSLWGNTWMLTKALAIPLRLRQNICYWHWCRQYFSSR